ncbi:hypothetical protein G9F31_11135 [Acinetobacter sp. 187]|uniref:SCP2 domain-containing protein n=1 Tax=Acinetobacter lanii TaxID=2715163 RepID=A0A6G8S5Z7_9GAMM|nr:hypothetical protein [Acinetobacter lanii]NHC04311.1 hypothetical protein [Acinetobacter lanii]QIO09534.1 hypothetical protein G8D99_11285 [Acinetobacter lanii]
MISIKSVKPALEQAYVKLMLDVIGRGLAMASQVDAEIKQDVSKFPVGFTVSMAVFNSDAAFIAQVNDQHHLVLVDHTDGKPDLTITFKHMHHAFLVFSFQESTAQAFANDRMVADGDLGHAIRLVRCLNKMEALILPKMVAELAIKEYPQQLTIKEKLTGAANIYLKVAQSYIKGSV